VLPAAVCCRLLLSWISTTLHHIIVAAIKLAPLALVMAATSLPSQLSFSLLLLISLSVPVCSGS
jgi:hypothetical protein